MCQKAQSNHMDSTRFSEWIAVPLSTSIGSGMLTCGINYFGLKKQSFMSVRCGMAYGFVSGFINTMSFPFFLKLKQRFPFASVPIYFTSSIFPWVISCYLLSKMSPELIELDPTVVVLIALINIFGVRTNDTILD
jgi:hypothetical protein